MTAVGVVDVGCANTASVVNVLRRIGVPAVPLTRPEAASALILPGVGSWDSVMGRLERAGWPDVLARHVDAGRPILGVCLGMQLLGRRSEEGSVKGLGFVEGDVRRLTAHAGVLVPRVGWRSTWPAGEEATPPLDRFYFSHSFHLVPDRPEEIVSLTTRHGQTLIAAGVRVGNVCGVQFHPERSHRWGMAFLRDWCGRVDVEFRW